MSMITDMISGMDEETASNIISSMDEEVIESALKSGIEQELVPHLQDVREKAKDEYEENEYVREKYESLSEDKQTKKFNKAAADIMSVAVKLRSSPMRGMQELKGRLRDPWTVEALLLIFDHPEVPDEVVEQRKNYAAAWLKYVGVNVIPEVYTREAAMDMIETFYPDSDPEEVLDQLGVE